jgi:hypothetical protein
LRRLGWLTLYWMAFEQELEKLRGEAKDTRTSVFKKVIITANTKRETIVKNWQVWGVKGLITTHFLFEGGLVGLVWLAPRYIANPNRYELKTIQHLGLVEYYKRLAREVATLDLYETFYQHGWTNKLAKTIKKELIPRMASMVTLAWYLAAHEAALATGEI